MKQADAQHNLNAAAAAGTAVLHTGRLYRPSGLEQQPGENIPALAVARLFSAEPGTAITAPGDNGSYVVARVTGVLHRPLPATSIQFLQGARQLSQQSAQDFDTLTALAARNKQGVKINQANADRVTGAGGDTGS
jgi:hypothetical protein